MKPALGPAWDMSLRDGLARIIRKSDGTAVAALTAGDAAVLCLMNGRRDLTRLALLLARAGLDSAEDIVQTVVARLGPLFVDGVSRELSLRLKDLEEITPSLPESSFRTLPGPRTLQWLVTRYCPRKCIYCYATPLHGSAALDATLTRDRLRELFAEAAELGTHTLMVTGGEPLLRPDLPEVLGDAIASGVEPLLTTKHPITVPLAKRLANAGLPSISLSLDSVDPEQNRCLVHRHDYVGCVSRSIQNLQDAGIGFAIQAVATRETLEDLDQLAAFCADRDAQVLLVSAFRTSGLEPRHDDNNRLASPDPQQLYERIHCLADSFSPLRIELFEPTGSDYGDRAYCDIGMNKLFFLPDGRVHRCYRLVSDETLVGADLSVTSLATAWHDPEFADRLSPARSAYVGTECYNCRQLTDCQRRGRCIFRAYLDHGAYTAKDRDCGGPFFL